MLRYLENASVEEAAVVAACLAGSFVAWDPAHCVQKTVPRTSKRIG